MKKVKTYPKILTILRMIKIILVFRWQVARELKNLRMILRFFNLMTTQTMKKYKVISESRHPRKCRNKKTQP
jgi:hypothetical protein